MSKNQIWLSILYHGDNHCSILVFLHLVLVCVTVCAHVFVWCIETQTYKTQSNF